MNYDVIVSKHAVKRLRKRLGLSVSGCQRHVEKAFKNGKIIQPLDNFKKALIKYNNYNYVFGLHNGNPILITVMNRKNLL